MDGHFKTGHVESAGTSGFYRFIDSLSIRIYLAASAFVFVFFFLNNLTSSRGCGNCGKLGCLLPSFPSAVGTVENMQFVFHGFHGAAVSTTCQPRTGLFEPRAKKRGPYLTLNEFLTKGTW
jgi:hypothetical protein